jgi:Ni2+-binding GTPase involved in maturation of urease and hydrogenase
MKKITRIGIGGPVGSGKTAIVEAITPRLIAIGAKILVITNDVVNTTQGYECASTATLDGVATFAPCADILASIHVKSRVRLFMN